MVPMLTVSMPTMRRSLCDLLVAASLLAASGAGGGTGQVQRLTSAYAGAPTGSPDSRTYTWDGNSNLTRIAETTAGQTIAVETQYDVHNRPIQLTDAWNRSWTQAFDDADQRLALTSNGIPAIQWQYDAGSRPVQITVEGAGTYALSYDLADRNTGITHPNAAETTHSFDTAGRITDIQHQRAGELTRYQYTYDPNGNRLSQTEIHGNQTIASSFAYDKADRLVTITEPDKHTAYTLDGSGNRTEVREGTNANNVQRKYTAEFNTRNQLTQQQQHDNGSVIATTSFHYDPNGNLIRQSTGGVETEWRYDVLDRLIETTPPTGPPTLYRYGPGDVRIAKVRDGQEVRYHYDGERLSLETNSLGNPQRHYVYSAAGLLNTTLLGPTPQYRSSHLDAMGSPVLITGSDGSIINRTRFDAWGVEQSLFGARDQAIAFQGYWSGIELEETGTQLSAARLYIPSLGIFAERDPVEGTAQEPISFNPYLLGRANPHYWMDPDGRTPLAPLVLLAETGAGQAAGHAVRAYGSSAIRWAGRLIGGAALAWLGNNEIENTQRQFRGEVSARNASGELPRNRVITPQRYTNPPSLVTFSAEKHLPTIYTSPGEQQLLPGSTAHSYPELPKDVVTGVLPGRQAEPVGPTVFTTPSLREDERGPNVLVFPSIEQQFQQVMRSEAVNEDESDKPIDFGAIPAEHQWRYERYLEGPSASKLGPEAWYSAAQRAWANNSSGNNFEQAVRTELGVPTGAGSKPFSIGGYVPDLPVGAIFGVTDVKNILRLTNTDQLRAFHEYAVENGLPFNLIVSPRTQSISEPLLNNVRGTAGSVVRYDPETREFVTVELGSSGRWSGD